MHRYLGDPQKAEAHLTDQEEVTVLATSAPDWAHPLPHLHRDLARRCHICTATELTPATSAPGLGSPRPHLHRDLARRCHICTGTGLTPATSAPQVREREYQADHNSLYTRKRTMDGQVYWKSEGTARAGLPFTHTHARACMSDVPRA